MTAAERFDMAARAAVLLEQAKALRDDLGRHYHQRGENLVAASAAWWALGPVERGLECAVAELVDRENPLPADSEAA